MKKDQLSVEPLEEKSNTTFEIKLEWEEVNFEDESRVGAMYCFKSCGVNNN